MLLEQSRLGEIERGSLVASDLGEFGQALVSAWCVPVFPF